MNNSNGFVKGIIPDTVYALKLNLRSRLRAVLKGKSKKGSAVRELGCTGEELREYLESLFEPGMSWQNYGNRTGCWSIDHVLPFRAFDIGTFEGIAAVSHYTNLCPMWQEDNIRKSNKLPDGYISKEPRNSTTTKPIAT